MFDLIQKNIGIIIRLGDTKYRYLKEEDWYLTIQKKEIDGNRCRDRHNAIIFHDLGINERELANKIYPSARISGEWPVPDHNITANGSSSLYLSFMLMEVFNVFHTKFPLGHMFMEIRDADDKLLSIYTNDQIIDMINKKPGKKRKLTSPKIKLYYVKQN